VPSGPDRGKEEGNELQPFPLLLFLHFFFVSSFLRFFVSSFLRFFVSSFLRFFVSSFLHFFVSSFLRFSLSQVLFVLFLCFFIFLFFVRFLHTNHRWWPGCPNMSSSLMCTLMPVHRCCGKLCDLLGNGAQHLRIQVLIPGRDEKWKNGPKKEEEEEYEDAERIAEQCPRAPGYWPERKLKIPDEANEISRRPPPPTRHTFGCCGQKLRLFGPYIPQMTWLVLMGGSAKVGGARDGEMGKSR
jgi:hypothetical protein